MRELIGRNKCNILWHFNTSYSDLYSYYVGRTDESKRYGRGVCRIIMTNIRFGICKKFKSSIEFWFDNINRINIDNFRFKYNINEYPCEYSTELLIMIYRRGCINHRLMWVWMTGDVDPCGGALCNTCRVKIRESSFNNIQITFTIVRSGGPAFMCCTLCHKWYNILYTATFVR